jgi:hypothetical protein
MTERLKYVGSYDHLLITELVALDDALGLVAALFPMDTIPC